MRPLQPSRSVPPAAESGRTDRDWKANLVPPSRVAHSPESRVSGSSRLWKDAHDARGRPAEPRRSNAPVAADPKDWVFVPVPALVDVALFRATQEQLQENRSRARLGRRRPGYLLQGLTCCARCGYAFYGKTTHQMGTGHQMKDFRYYRCSGSDGYRFGGERICSNAQIQGQFLESAVWHEVWDLLVHPERLEHECLGGRVG